MGHCSPWARAGSQFQRGQEGGGEVLFQEVEDTREFDEDTVMNAIGVLLSGGTNEKGEETSSPGKSARKRLWGFVRGWSLGVTRRKCTETHTEIISISR